MKRLTMETESGLSIMEEKASNHAYEPQKNAQIQN
jgi:hypothetical protein